MKYILRTLLLFVLILAEIAWGAYFPFIVTVLPPLFVVLVILFYEQWKQDKYFLLWVVTIMGVLFDLLGEMPLGSTAILSLVSVFVGSFVGSVVRDRVRLYAFIRVIASGIVFFALEFFVR